MLGVISNAVEAAMTVGASTLLDAQHALAGAVDSSPVASLCASVGILGRLFRTREVMDVLACMACEESALEQGAAPQILFGFRLAKRHIRDAVLAQSAEITEKIRGGATPRALLYKTVKEVCEADLGSGSVHCGPGELSLPGKALLALCARASKELESEGMHTRDATFREMERLRHEIARVGQR